MSDMGSHNRPPGNWPVPSGGFRRDELAERRAAVPSVVGMRGSPKGNEGGSTGLTVGLVLFALRRWWKVSFPVGLVLAAVAGGVVWLLFEPVYLTQAWLNIDAQKEYVAFQPARDDGDRYIRTQIELIKSPIVLGRVIGQPEVAKMEEIQESESPIDWLADRVKVRSVNESDLFTIEFSCSEAAGSANVTNAVLDAYLKIQSDTANQQTQRIIELLELERERRRQGVERQRKNVRVLAKQRNDAQPVVFDPLSQQTVTLPGPLPNLLQQMATSELERAVEEARLTATQEELAQQDIEISEAAIDQALEEAPQLARLNETAMLMREEVESWQTTMKKGIDPPAGLVQSKRNLAQVEERLAGAREELRPQIVENLTRDKLRETQAEIEQMKKQIDNANYLEGVLTEQIRKEQEKLEAQGNQSLDLEFARADLMRANTIYTMIADRLEQLKTELQAPHRITPLQRASPPAMPVEKIPLKQMLAACGGAFFFPFGLSVLWEYRTRRIAEVAHIQEATNLPVVGEVTSLPMQLVDPRRRTSRRLERYRYMFEESVDSVRNCLTLSQMLAQNQVLAIASAVSREGKSSLASQLAISLAQASHEPILLIDADVRAPDLHVMFDISLEPGLVDVLDGVATADAVIHPTWCENLEFLPAGRLHKSPHLLLGNGNFRRVLDDLRSRYRYIVVDAPPVLPASDALIIAHAADGTLVATMRDVSRARHVREACTRLRTAGANLLGAVLSGVPMRTYARRYGSYGSYRDDPYQYYHEETNGETADEEAISEEAISEEAVAAETVATGEHNETDEHNEDVIQTHEPDENESH